MAPSLLSILSNEYLLLSTTPYLLPGDLLSLARTSRSFHDLVTHSRSVWRHLDLSVPDHAWGGTTTAINFLAAPQSAPSPFRNLSKLQRLLTRPFVLRDVKTLILDGLPVTTELLSGLLTGDAYRIQILSIRECTHINEFQLMGLLQYLLRNTRDRAELRLKGVYYFGDADSPSCKAQEKKNARFVDPRRITNGWVDMLQACAGHIAFDTRLCTGPRHRNGTEAQAAQRVANVRLMGTCAGCGTTPEKREGREAELQKVLVAPVPVMSSDVRVACSGGVEGEVLRCQSCVQDTWCRGCDKWWCEDCVEVMDKQKRITDECIECGPMCYDCNSSTTRTCKSCRGGYCLTHSPEADDIHCEWCNSRERRNRPDLSAPLVRTVSPPMPVPRAVQVQQTGQTFTNAQQRARTIARLNALRASLGAPSRFADEVIVRRRCLVGS